MTTSISDDYIVDVSVVMPVYNSEQTLQRSLGSVLTQSYRALELIVVDDCSNDKC